MNPYYDGADKAVSSKNPDVPAEFEKVDKITKPEFAPKNDGGNPITPDDDKNKGNIVKEIKNKDKYLKK